jgi:hypothetical protein
MTPILYEAQIKLGQSPSVVNAPVWPVVQHQITKIGEI